ncbi:hypothetical protein IFU40_06320 [Microbacterium sp. CFBP 13617]|uniref:hypothetical protein n=1 Tax=Microbacterium sp. CFBP 13617 TaxID=2774035 RepID=UPI001782DA8B|nr:hypothetical protein [Microbacterium sp. CFBP 13617]MBD8218248.1 hypothetical protein [Microbacterium sp. CFBP 13617]
MTAIAKHPVGALVVFIATLYALILLMSVSPLLAFIVACIIGLALLVVYIVEGLALYISFDCHDGRHSACDGCWCAHCPHIPLTP